MRIAYILNTLQMGGAERQVLALAERMRARGHGVRILVLREPGHGDLQSDLCVVHLGAAGNPVPAIRSYANAVRELRAFRPDVVHSNQFHGNMLGRAVKLAMPSVPVISTIHNVHEGGWMRMLAYRVSDPMAARTVAVCEAARERFAGVGAIRRGKSSVIANGVDTGHFAPDARRRDAVRAEMQAGGSFVWIAVGRMAPAKDYATMLWAFARVHAARPEARLWIAGEGKPEYVAALKRQGGELGVSCAVRWLGLREDVRGLLDAADGFVLSSAWEGMPLALGEAMAMEKPFVATDVGGVGEMSGSCGRLVGAGDAEGLADAMTRIMDADRGALREAGRAARARIVEQFSMERHVDAWETLYAQVARV